MEAFIESLTPDDFRSMREVVCIGYLAVFAALTFSRFLVHLMSQPVPWRGFLLTPNFPMAAASKSFFSKSNFLVAAAGAIVAAMIYLFLSPSEPISATAPASGVVFLLGLEKQDILTLFETMVLIVAAVIIIRFGVRPFLNMAFAQLSASQSISAKKPSISSPYLDFSVVVVAAVGGATFLHKMYPRLAEPPIDPSMANHGGGALFIGLSRLQILGFFEQIVLFVIAVLVFRLVIRRLWVKSLTSGIAISNFAQKAVSFICWATGIVFSLLLLWRIYQIITL